MIAMHRMGGSFKEFDSNSTVMVVVEGQQALGPDAHFTTTRSSANFAGPAHQHIQDFWGRYADRCRCPERRRQASYVMLNLAGQQRPDAGSEYEGVQKVRDIIKDTPAPPGVQAYISPDPLPSPTCVIGNASLGQITLYTLVGDCGDAADRRTTLVRCCSPRSGCCHHAV